MPDGKRLIVNEVDQWRLRICVAATTVQLPKPVRKDRGTLCSFRNLVYVESRHLGSGIGHMSIRRRCEQSNVIGRQIQ